MRNEKDSVNIEMASRSGGSAPDGMDIFCAEPFEFSRYPSDRYAGRQPRLERV